MSLTRITFRNTDTTGSYTLPINPDTFDPVDSADFQLIETLDGASARVTSTFDSRVRNLKWPAYPTSNATFLAMVSVLKGYKGLEKQIYLGTLDDIFSYGYRNIKICDVRTILQQGGDTRLALELDYIYTSSY